MLICILMSSHNIYHYNGRWGYFDYLYFQLGCMKNIASLKVVQRFEIISIYSTSLMEKVEERNFSANKFVDRASNSALESWKGGRYFRDHLITTLIWLWEKRRPEQLKDSPMVLYSWLVTDSELKLGNPEFISVVLKLAHKFNNPHFEPMSQKVFYVHLMNAPSSEY